MTSKSYVDSVNYTRALSEELKLICPEDCVVRVGIRYDEIILINCPSENDLVDMTAEAVENMGWKYRELDLDEVGYNAAAIDLTRFVYLSYFYNDFENEGYVSITFPNSNVVFTDWY